MISGSLFPLILVLLPIAGGFIGYAAGRKNKKLRDVLAAGFAILTFVLVIQLIVESALRPERRFLFRWENFGGLSLSFSADGFRLLLCALASFLWMGATCFCREYFEHHRNRNRFYLFFLWTLGATMGVFLAADLFTLFLFFEMMSFTSYVWVAQEEDEKARKAAGTYLGIAVIGGLAMLMGLFLLYDMFGTLDILELSGLVGNAFLTSGGRGIAGAVSGEAAAAFIPSGHFAGADGRVFGLARLYVAGGCLLAGFGAKAGMVPLHVWLPKAHPVAPAPASALLSGMLTKTGVYGIILLCVKFFANDAYWRNGLYGNAISAVKEMGAEGVVYATSPWGLAVLAFAMATMVTGAVQAVFSTDLKRTLACSSMSQIGFILCGASMIVLTGGGVIAVSGTVLHIVNHALIKLVLFLSAGAIYMKLHKLDLNEIRGYGRNKPFLKACFLTGALSISGVPLFSGYISKTLLHESIKEYMEWAANPGAATACEILFIVTGGLTLAYMLKLYYAIFVEKGDGEDGKAAETVKNAETVKKGEMPYGLPAESGKRSQVHYGRNAGQNSDARNRRISGMTVTSALCIGIPAAILLLCGVLPHVFFDRATEFTQNFFGSAGIMAKLSGVSYFSLENLLEASDSIGIGLAVYFGFVRLCLMRRNEQGVRVYADAWPKWMDLEELIYRPLLLRLLPFLFGVVCRVFDRLADGIVTLLKRTVFAPRKVRLPAPVGTRMTYMIGTLLDDFVIFLNRTLFRKKPIRVSFVNLFAVGKKEVDQTTRLITRSVSFGLLMFCIGFCLTLIYLLFYY